MGSKHDADQLLHSYAASVSFADNQVAQLLANLGKLGLKENTLIEKSLRPPLVISAPGMKSPGKKGCYRQDRRYLPGLWL